MNFSFSLGQIFAIGVGYLLILFACAYATERQWLPRKLTRHPVVYVLSLGVYASAWAVYGSVGLANQYGYGFLSYYLGVAGAFVLAPVLLVPILRISRTYQLSSLADLFAFRFRSRWIGSLVTVFMLMASMPLLALQIQAVADSIYILTNEASPHTLALAFCLVITTFAILFGARHTSLREKHESLVAAIAFESIIKLAIMLAIGSYALFEVFDGFQGLEVWLQSHSDQLQALQKPLEAGQWRTMLLLFFAAAVAMPHMFHIIFTENQSTEVLFRASWAVPLYLLLLSLPVPLILWAGMAEGINLKPEYMILGLGKEETQGLLGILAFIAGLSAASGTIILVTLALAAMTLNHLVLAVYQPGAKFDIYNWLLWFRRLLIGTIIVAAYLFYRTLGVRHNLASLGLTSFVGILQFLPGILAVLYWPTANRIGLIAGLCSGIGIWIFGQVIPLLYNLEQVTLPASNLVFHSGSEGWYQVALVSITLNITVFIVTSLFIQPSEEEKEGASSCSVDALSRPHRLQLNARTCQDFVTFLSVPLGESTAKREVQTALNGLKLEMEDSRPYAMRRLRDRIQANLSGLMGPAIAQEIVDQYLPYQPANVQGHTEDIHFVESRLESYRSQLTGLAKELDSLRRYHRQTLQYLPIGVCSLGTDREVLMWNNAMAELTSISGEQVIGSRFDALPEPWKNLLDDFIQQNHNHHMFQKVSQKNGQPRWFSLHKARIEEPLSHMGGMVILLEDHTETQRLEEELVHSERLASIGRLAAGVAHEIGNPITGISSLAQNMKYETDNPEVIQTSEQILQLTKRVTRIVHSLVSFAHAGRHTGQNQQEPMQLNQAITEAINLISLADKGKELEFINLCSDDIIVIADIQKLVQVFVNLLGNARDASEVGDSVTISAQVSEHTVTVSVTDQGCGIPEDQLEHIFEPFFTTKEPGEGTGLGLALVYSIVEEHYGQIHIISPADRMQGRGTQVDITLPLHHAEAKSESAWT
ncbi:PAS domain S-box-containing protein [Oceanospirillum multiglobuliferum]|uniref:histidine kinase n=1 Tax=Oceanospirillum multiglobuliferum TaxID=64969 RepID=A0A1T4RFX6_9GAMM|nr:sensor histidine kinase [Oceanospirillum multiglobuliferum]OPX54905.1 ATPase [Oceanospirillum multiglobuliferum]SKA14571.1 PAS domain S-box-containing protein [Oceanospirillum multiglobuliferum]